MLTTKSIRERLAHNERYLAQPLLVRREASALTYGRHMTEEWLAGEAAAIKAENEWLAASIAPSKMAEPRKPLIFEPMDLGHNR